ncbi:NUDIX domain-containing protein [Geomicrobium sediminis]|uniref:8-oxo-dGTP diphosphatase n=1 Tax=Geomicrobium sediminis TaxID=1347788 RepID=A0ABS2PC54_9BACL|nr:8-oxo-dGTP diphosphatase [Geomicrobium sediminis]
MKRLDVVYALIRNQNDEVLVVENENSRWSLPGGAVEEGETLEQALIREVYEETALHVERKGLAAVHETKFHESGHHCVFFTFQVEVVGGTIERLYPEEITKIEWVPTEVASERMPYLTNGIEPLFDHQVTYTYQK